MTRLVVLGGFLGAGKTTTLLLLAGDLVRAGKRVGVLTNDQGQELVDAELFRASGFETRDVRGGCFCCRLDDFVVQAQALTSTLLPDFLLAEPVGSCTDLVATVLRPLRNLHPIAFDIAPFTVLVDPFRARNALSPTGRASLSEKVTYIYRLQQMEAAAIAVNKTDQLGPNELGEVIGMLQMQFPKQRILSFSAATGDGFDALAEWLVGHGDGTLPASPPIDYDAYAEGEAELAWFDGRFDIVASTPIDMDDALTKMGSLLRGRILLAGLEIAHVKMLLRAGERTCALSIPRNDAQPSLSLRAAGNGTALELVVNARVAARPEVLRTLVEECLESWDATIAAAVSERTASAFSPGRPVPTHRVD